jgi:hypothetical protein
MNKTELSYWSGTIDGRKNFLTNVGGIECVGDINVGGTFKINGVPITAFRTPTPVVLKTGVQSINNQNGDLEFIGGTNIQIVQAGKKLTISSNISEIHHNWKIEPGDNITIDRNGDILKINADPGDWQMYTPRVVDVEGNIIDNRSLGEFIVWGPICHIQLSVNTEWRGMVKVSLPIAANDEVRQSLSGYELVGSFIYFPRGGDLRAGGSYRIV